MYPGLSDKPAPSTDSIQAPSKADGVHVEDLRGDWFPDVDDVLLEVEQAQSEGDAHIAMITIGQVAHACMGP